MNTKELFANDLYLFYRYFITTDYQNSVPAPHIKTLAHELMKLMITDEYHRLAVSMPPRHLLADSTPVLTYNRGWTTHGDLRIGDYVYGLDGKPTRIIGISPKQECDRLISFSNGEQILAHKEHLWSVHKRGNNEKRIQVFPTEELEKNFSYKNKQKTRYRYHLPLSEPIQYEKKELPLDPYWLGLWLGDGSSTKPCITHSKEDNQFIEKVPYKVSTQTIHKETGVYTTYFSNQGLIQKIKEMGLYNNKHIPSIYKESSIKQRLQLLAGLIDSDGSVDKNGRVRFVNTNKKLIEDVYELCQGLALYPYKMAPVSPKKINEYKKDTDSIKSKKTSYTIGFQPRYEIPTNIPRKQINKKGIRRKIAITNIEKTMDGEMGHCIEVEAEDGIYLVGKTLIPTHNSKSSMVTLAFPLWLIFQNPNRNILIITTGGLTEKFGIKIREYVREYGEQFNCYLSDVKQASTHIMFCDKNKHLYKGSIRLTGIGGSVTGQDADVVILDDPYKGLDEEFTPTALQKKIDWVNRVLEQRIEPHTRYCVLHTRWHPIADHTPVLTHNRGWTTHGDLKKGDYVFDTELKPVKVKMVHPKTIVDNYFIFDNGETIISGDDHQWNPLNDPPHLHTTRNILNKKQHHQLYQFFSARNDKVTLKDCFKGASMQGNCITVDSDDGLYLVGKSMIATHNSKDIIGYYKETQPHLFKFINFSAIQSDGTPLWKERYTIDELMMKKENMGDRMFSSIYQQIPLDMTSDFFTMSHLKYEKLDDDEKILSTVRSWDISGADSMTSDYTSGALLSITDKGNIILHDIVYGKFGSDTIDVIRETARLDTPNIPVLIETGVAGAGLLLFEEWKSQLVGYRVEQSKPIKSKVDRATPLRNMIFDGLFKVDLPMGDKVREVFLNEFSSFPNGEHDDIVDSVAYGVNWLKHHNSGLVRKKPGLVRIRR